MRDGGALASAAADLLAANSNPAGTATRASGSLYPHLWSWDAAFVAIGWAAIDPLRAAAELDSLLAGQWADGMVPHIVFDPEAAGYFPGPDRWEAGAVTDRAPSRPATSGICQPPVHAVAAARILERSLVLGGSVRQRVTAWLAGVYPRLLAWHGYLDASRRDAGTGLLTIYHGWESGTDNSPRWDGPYAAVKVGPDLPPYRRLDTAAVAAPDERPSDADYDRYLWLLEVAKRSGYEARRLGEVGPFAVGDVLFTAIHAAACDALTGIAAHLGEPPGVGPMWAERSRQAVLRRCDPSTGLAADADLRTGRSLGTDTVAAFAPLVAGGIEGGRRAALLATLEGPRFAGDPALRWPLPPSTSPCAGSFDPRCYWRGPVWPVTTWLLWWALGRSGESAAAGRLRAASLEQVRAGGFSEYFDPFTGAPLGSAGQSWTAAVALDWLAPAVAD